MKPKFVRNAYSPLSAVLESAVEAEHIVRSVARGAPLLKDDYKGFTAIFLVVGCRINEATPMQVRDFDKNGRLVRIVRALKKARNGKVLGTPKSRRSRRVVKLPDWAVHLFAQHSKGKKPEDLLFTTPTDRRIRPSNYRDRQWDQALTRSGITKHVTPHTARHTFASWALMAGVAPQTVQHRLGHESLATTSEVYGHLLLEAQDEAVEAIEWEPPKELE